MTTQDLLAVLGGGGIIGGIVALFSMRANKDKVVMDVAQGAVVVASGVIDTLKEEMERLKQNHEDCEKRFIQKDRIHGEQMARLRAEVRELRTVFDAIDERQAARRATDEVKK